MTPRTTSAVAFAIPPMSRERNLNVYVFADMSLVDVG